MQTTKQKRQAGFTLVETMVSILIMGLVFAGTIMAYTRATQRAEWSGYQLAAESLCQKGVEQFHGVVWDGNQMPQNDPTTNIPRHTVAILDIPISGSNVVWATNDITMVTWTNAGPSYLKMITVNTTWPWYGRVFTNTIVTYRRPDQT